jgi:ABC-type transport system involved in Fe-S cluster assembly fused permease/ATPase subunit
LFTKKLKINSAIVIIAILLDLLVLGAFLWIKVSNDFLVIMVSIVLMFLVFVGERRFLQWKTDEPE